MPEDENLATYLPKLWQRKTLTITEKYLIAVILTKLYSPAKADFKDILEIKPKSFATEINFKKNQLISLLIELENKNWLEFTDKAAENFAAELHIKVNFNQFSDRERSNQSKLIGQRATTQANNEDIVGEEKETAEELSQELINCWQNHFPGRLLTPTEYNHLLSFLEKGMEILLVRKLIAYTARVNPANPVSYLKKILSNLLENDIKSWVDYQKSYEEKLHDEQKQIPENNRGKEAREKLQDVEELEKKGWI